MNRGKDNLPPRCWSVFEAQRRWSLVLDKGNVPNALASSDLPLVSLSGCYLVWVPLSLSRRDRCDPVLIISRRDNFALDLCASKSWCQPPSCAQITFLDLPFYSNQLGEGITWQAWSLLEVQIHKHSLGQLLTKGRRKLMNNFSSLSFCGQFWGVSYATSQVTPWRIEPQLPCCCLAW